VCQPYFRIGEQSFLEDDQKKRIKHINWLAFRAGVRSRLIEKPLLGLELIGEIEVRVQLKCDFKSTELLG